MTTTEQAAVIVAGGLLVGVLGWGAAALGDGVTAVDPGIRPGTGGLGGVIANVTAGERQLWLDGRNLFFSKRFTEEEGLGPRFNSVSCLSCHSQPAVGGTGAATNPQASIPSEFPGNHDFSFIRPDGPTREARVVLAPDGSPDGGVHALFTITGSAGAPGCQIEQEDLDAQLGAGNLIFRIPTPVFGAGLIENIPDAAIRANAASQAVAKSANGIGGHPNVVMGDPNHNGNDDTIARFGWKAQNKSLLLFAGEAMNVEQGISNELFPTERDETGACQFRPAPNDFTPADDNRPFLTAPAPSIQARSALIHLAFLMRFHKQPSRVAEYTSATGVVVSAESVARGALRFVETGCALCHTPAFLTDPNAQSAALRGKVAEIFSDLLVHDMGKGLADGVTQGQAGPQEFRTAPLWGVGQRIFLLHDGRTTDIVAAVLAHASAGSQAQRVIQQFRRLGPQEQQDLVNFLRSL